jgi:hypothetical protein
MANLESKDVLRYAKNGDLQTYFITPWKCVERQMQILQEIKAGCCHHAPTWMVVDTELIRARAHQFLQEITSRAGLRFSKRMIYRWRKDHLFNLNNDEWTWKVSSARRLYRPRRHAPDMREFPESWHAAMHEAFGIYLRVLQNEHSTRLLSTVALNNMCRGVVTSHRRFAHLPPDTRYALGLTNDVFTHNILNVINDIRSKHPKYAMVFDSLDRIVGRRMLHGSNQSSQRT